MNLPRILASLVLACAFACPAYAQIQYGTAYSGPTCANPKNLDGAVLQPPPAKYCVVNANPKMPNQWLYDRDEPVEKNADGTWASNASQWTEKTAPSDWQGGEGNLVTFESGTHTFKIYGTTIAATFSVTFVAPNAPVVKPPNGTDTATITWALATALVNGTPLTDVAGYDIYTGTQLSDVSSPVATASPTSTSYTAHGLDDGVHYFAVRTVRIDPDGSGPLKGAVSDLSNIVAIEVKATTVPPPPVDCVLSPWMDGTAGPWLPEVCANGTQTQVIQQSRVVVTPAANGGAACGQLTGTRAATRPCTVPPPPATWKVALAASGSRPIYEAVLNAAGNATVRGNPEGQIPVGKPCGAEVFKVSSNSYRSIAENDGVLDSPTYRGRQHVAICTLTKP